MKYDKNVSFGFTLIAMQNECFRSHTPKKEGKKKQKKP